MSARSWLLGAAGLASISIVSAAMHAQTAPSAQPASASKVAGQATVQSKPAGGASVREAGVSAQPRDDWWSPGEGRPIPETVE